MISHYQFDSQIRQYLLQIVSIFYGLQIKTGIGECGVSEFISVPIVIGNKDRVVAALMAGNTQNRVFSLPTMALDLVSLNIAPDRRKVQAYVDQRVTLPVGGVFPTDLTVVKRAMPIPYNMTVELSIYASNTNQRDQILEQILVLFNPDLQIQKSDGPFDWTKITRVELTDISNESNYPAGTDKRFILWSLTFEVPIYLSIPMGVKDDLVRKVIIRLGDLDSLNIGEVDENGELVFGDSLATLVFDTTVPSTDPNHYQPEPLGPNIFAPDQLP
jgi:T4-like virus Myoviridae tail sheath stabiliser